jgi:hypothetical protein
MLTTLPWETACRQSTKIREIDFVFSMNYEPEFWSFWEPEEAKAKR